MGWVARWRETRAEAAVRRQLTALEHERRAVAGQMAPPRRVGLRLRHESPDVPPPGSAIVDMGPGAGMDTARRHGSVSPSVPFLDEQLASPVLGGCYPVVHVDETRGDSRGDVVLCGAHGCVWGTGGCPEEETP